MSPRRGTPPPLPRRSPGKHRDGCLSLIAVVALGSTWLAAVAVAGIETWRWPK